jgi:hypothetical protein
MTDEQQLLAAAERITAGLVYAEDAEMLAEHVRSTVRADDSEPVTIEWLNELELPCRGAVAVRMERDGFHLMVPGPPTNGIAGLMDWVCPNVATRGQVRQLITALKGTP